MSGKNDPNDGFERLLRGEDPGTPAERDLGAFLDDVRTAFPSVSSGAEDLHLVRIAEAARVLADKGDPVARPVSNAAGRAGHASGLPKRRETIMRVPIYRSLAAKVVAGLVVLMSMFGGVAFAGVLPGGVQDAVANAVSGVVDLPGGDDETEADDPTGVEADDPTADETEAPDPADGDQGQTGDDQTDVNNDQTDVNNDQTDVNNDQTDVNDDQGQTGDDQTDVNNDQTDVNDDQGQTGDDQTDVNNDQTDVNDDQGQTGDDQGENGDTQGDTNQDAGDGEQ